MGKDGNASRADPERVAHFFMMVAIAEDQPAALARHRRRAGPRARRGLFRRIEALDARVKEAPASVDLLSARVDNRIGEAVASLQLEDLLTRIVTCVERIASVSGAPAKRARRRRLREATPTSRVDPGALDAGTNATADLRHGGVEPRGRRAVGAP